MHRSQILLLKPNKQTELLFRGSAGLSRFAWNWALAFSKRYYHLFKKSISSYTLGKFWNKIKTRRFPWVSDYSKYIPEASFKALENAMKATFSRLKKKQKTGFPKFKKKGLNDSFQVVPANQFPLTQYGNRFHIPRIGKVKFQGQLRWPKGKQLVGRIKKRAGRWWLSLNFELPDPPKLPGDRPICGIDLGCKAFATVVSDKCLVESIAPPKPYSKAKRRLRRLQRVISRRKKGGSNRWKAVLRVSIAHKRVSDIRHDFLNKLTSKLVSLYGVIGIENLNVAAMGKGFLSGTIQDLSFAEFRRQMEYKSEAVGTRIVVADRFYPSSKTCSSCKHVKDSIALSERVFSCDRCGLLVDRDVNAAINLEQQCSLPQGLGEVTPTETGSSSARKGRGAGRRSGNVIKS